MFYCDRLKSKVNFYSFFRKWLKLEMREKNIQNIFKPPIQNFIWSFLVIWYVIDGFLSGNFCYG